MPICQWHMAISSFTHRIRVAATSTLTPSVFWLNRNLPEFSKIIQCTFGNMPLSSKCTMHFRWSFIFSTRRLYFLPGSNFAPFEEVKVPFSNSADFYSQKVPFWGFRVVRVNPQMNFLGYVDQLQKVYVIINASSRTPFLLIEQTQYVRHGGVNLGD